MRRGKSRRTIERKLELRQQDQRDPCDAAVLGHVGAQVEPVPEEAFGFGALEGLGLAVSGHFQVEFAGEGGQGRDEGLGDLFPAEPGVAVGASGRGQVRPPPPLDQPGGHAQAGHGHVRKRPGQDMPPFGRGRRRGFAVGGGEIGGGEDQQRVGPAEDGQMRTAGGCGGGVGLQGGVLSENARARSEDDRAQARGGGGWGLAEAFRGPERTER